VKIELKGLDQLKNNLEQISRAAGILDGEVTRVRFNPNNPADVSRAARELERKIDSNVAPYSSNPAVRDIVAGIKGEFKKGLFIAADEARLKSSRPKEGSVPWNVIHPAIAAISQKKFNDGHYADAAESAFKEVNNRVKEHVRTVTGNELDGAALMNKAFSLQNPVITLSDLSTETGRNMQQGYMQIFAGSMTGIRNPKAHQNLSISPEQAIHFLFLASLLMGKLDEAQIPALSGPDNPNPIQPGSKIKIANIVPTQSLKETLRDKMLLLMSAHEDTGSATFLSDKAIAEELSIELREAQKQLLILEDKGLIQMSKAMGPSYGARLEAAGLARIEELQEAQ
jgi:uncharacterized protein (TIGR02391 family)